MQLKKYTDYGLRVLMYLAAKEDNERVTIDELSGIFNVPRNHLNKVVHQLGKEGLIETRRGKNGGFLLAVDPADVRLDQVIRRLEGDEYWIDCHKPECAIFPVCELKSLINQGKETFYNFLSNYTLASLLKHESEIRELWGTPIQVTVDKD
ncbi:MULTISPECIES: Rrf2 family transcriptional regulator [Idiomarina]|jgi:Rrf2 family nitric oxide-sensitive transcriptional repressor|uniref:Rrf2 family transcriptional regulator n=1 Tax=Idiomarina abyssalis TaxID=86102 RepID=A0A8I1G9T8_9GAMM|nr:MULTISPECIES: Rrf2 family transcriptional regulator [Idiomarina]RDX34391.1 Rrf2 family transcriptional regulator [Idiomarina sp. HD9-110m-PIT-SAG05]KPD21112.1 transcriptional regulator [Idiomarina abyssalis]MAB21410.1 transcriptional regulator [Idiomarina sp.]MAO68782.1 transcriptional regulator [Idiomarina sp.]MBE91556.1 transcriptional regulator [Idiomarina sp.]|tara:strand:- start:1367 stop:1819 length:453 start_codon:yes stop_codon:yes gene_type:complete